MLRGFSVDFACRAKTGEFVDTGFELFNFVLELVSLWVVSSSELIFEALEAGFFTLFVDIGFADVLAFVDLVEIRFREVGDFECLVDFGAVDGGNTFAINTLVVSQSPLEFSSN